MRRIYRTFLILVVLGLAQFSTSCAEEPCDCRPISQGKVLNITAPNGEPVTHFTATIGFPKMDPRYNPENPRMQPLTVSCPDGPIPEPLVCDENAVVDPFRAGDSFGDSGFPQGSADFGDEITVEGLGKWEGLSFEGLKWTDRLTTESVDVGFSGCCGGTRTRMVLNYDLVIAE